MRDVATIFAQLLDARLRRMGAGDPEVLDAMAAVPRHRFVPRSIGMLAYLDRAQPIGEGQTISQPSMVATMLTVARLVPNDRVMEIGVGSGYVAAVLARLAAEIYAVERVATLAVRARRILDELGVRNVTIVEGDGSLGLPEQAPFDAILVSAAAPGVPRPLLDQLGDGGRLVVPVGDQSEQRLLRITRVRNRFTDESLGRCLFVPLIGAYGWPEPT